jgi:glycosyltransferase involved in cell wall biosynthesis
VGTDDAGLVGTEMSQEAHSVKSRRKIRVLQLGSPTGLYGAERWILALVNNIDRDKIDVEVAVILDDPTLNADLCRQAERIGIPATIFEAYGKFNWSAVKQLRAHIVRNGIDVLHTHGYKTDIIGILATRGTGCKIITTPHGWSTNAGYRLKVYESLDRAAFLFFDGVVPLSSEIYNGLKYIPVVRNKLQLIPNGVDLSDVDEVNEIADELLDLKSNGCFVVGYIGQLIRRKGLDVLLIAFQRLTLPKKHLVIVGDGEQRADLESLAGQLGIRDSVTFCGFRKDRVALLKGFDVFVLPSRLEGIPRCLMEAMAAGVPVITSNIPGCIDLVQHERTGLLFDVDRADSLHMRMQELVANDVMREKMKINARQLIVEKYSAGHMARQYADLYSGLARGNQ